jgi:hypothetical protein
LVQLLGRFSSVQELKKLNTHCHARSNQYL